MPTQTKKPTVHLHKVEVDVATKHDIDIVRQEINGVKTELNAKIDHNAKIFEERIDNVKEHINKTWQIMLAGFGLVLVVTIGGFTLFQANMQSMEKRNTEQMQAIKTDMQADMQAMEKRNTEQMQAIKTDMQADMQAMEKRNIERHNELKRLIQKGK